MYMSFTHPSTLLHDSGDSTPMSDGHHFNRRSKIASTESVHRGAAGDCFAYALPLLLPATVQLTDAKHAFRGRINRISVPNSFEYAVLVLGID